MFEPEWHQPEPPGVKPVKSRNPWTPVIIVAVLIALVALAIMVPIPIFWRYLPGPVHDVERLIEIEGAPDYSSEGSLYLTTVNIDTTVTFADWIGAAFDEDSIVVLKQDVTGGGSEEQLLEEAANEMRISKVNARNVALGELGLLQPSARVQRIATGSPAEGKIQTGDVILSVDGQPVYTVCDVGVAIREQGVDQPIEVVVRRDGRERELDMRTDALDPSSPEVAMIGIVMEQGDAVASDGPRVTIPTGEIGGPSAGLMFALAVYDRLTPDDLTDGRQIAGTGVINCDGSVAPIGGIEQKVAAAEAEGAEVFLAPADNFEAAKESGDEIDVVSVESFDDAIEYLEDLG